MKKDIRIRMINTARSKWVNSLIKRIRVDDEL